MHVMHLKDGKATESWVVSKDQVATDASGVSPATGAGYRSLVRDGPADARCCMWRSAATARLVTRDRGGAASPAMLRRVTRIAAVTSRLPGLGGTQDAASGAIGRSPRLHILHHACEGETGDRAAELWAHPGALEALHVAPPLPHAWRRWR